MAHASAGDYFVIEDTNPLGPARPLESDETPYQPFGNIKLENAREFAAGSAALAVDASYCDRFGLNCSNQWNSIFRFCRADTGAGADADAA